ncbi:MAG: YbbR-like domain-containing protein [Desulfobacteraceae bacterium]|nr:YbbR-like domain-containing protein [Desulfobacteraceae bacterium]
MPNIRRHNTNYLLRLLCVFFLFSLYGCTAEPVETDILIPVKFSSVPNGLVLTSYYSDKLEIRIQGDQELIDLITKENINYTVDLYTDLEFDPAGASESVEPGAYLIPVTKARIPLGPQIKILSFTPSYLGVQLEKKITRQFNITVPYTGDPSKGFIALQAACKPNRISLTGAEPVLNSIQEVKTKPVDLTNADEDFKKKVPIDIDSSLAVVSSDGIIIVTVPVKQQLITRTLEKIPVQLINAPSKISIVPPAITIEIKGPFDVVSNKEVIDKVYAFMNIEEGLKPGVYARHAYINIPVDLIMTQADPKVFTVKIE